MRSLKLKKIFISEEVLDADLTKDILQRLPEVPREIITDSQRDFGEVSIKEGKSLLYITNFKGKFFKPCPGTSQDYLCCNYQIINEVTGCPMDCSYCILQSYLNARLLTVYANFDRIFSELDTFLLHNSRRIVRIGTGELSDSLALEEITGLSTKLISYFKTKENVLFEIKTKTAHVDFLPAYAPPASNVVVAWSLNPSQLIKNIEFKSDSLARRLRAAKEIQAKGYKLAFHFDPIINHPQWQQNYQTLIGQLFEVIDPNRIVWLSLGGLRFPPPLKAIISERFPQSALIRDEQIIGSDQKLRYFKPLRLKLFKFIYSEIRFYAPDVFVYFCMESKDVWEKVMGFSPQSTNHLDYLFARSLYERFPEMNFRKPHLAEYLNLQSKHRHVDQIKL